LKFVVSSDSSKFMIVKAIKPKAFTFSLQFGCILDIKFEMSVFLWRLCCFMI
jgi:hypothetical protein